MIMSPELFQYLARAAQGDDSECPPEIDAVWHACLAYPQTYEAYCLEHFGVVIDHISSRPDECHSLGPCRARIRP